MAIETIQKGGETMEIAKVQITGNIAKVLSRKPIVSGTIGATGSFVYDESWEGMDKTLVWSAGGVTKDDTTASGIIPAEVLARPNTRLKVGVYGTKDGTATPTVWADLGMILPGADPSGDESTDPSLPVWAQLQAAIEELKQQTGGEVDPAEIQRIVEEYLAANPPAPGNGIAAVVLNDDYTLTVILDDVTSYTTPSIRGEKGEKGDKGEPGADGKTPVKGEDYFTPEEVQEIAEQAAALVEVPDSSQNANQGLNDTASALLIAILRNGVYSTDQSANITALETVLGSSGDNGENEAVLSSISATYSGGEVATGTAVADLTGIVVTATYSNGSTATVTDYALSGEIAEGENTITVSYGGMVTTFMVVGVAESSGILPAGYTQVEYISSAKSDSPSANDLLTTPYIKNVFPSVDTDILDYTVTCTFQQVFSNVEAVVFGGRNGSSNSQATRGTCVYVKGSVFSAVFANNDSQTTNIICSNMEHDCTKKSTIVLKNGKVYMDGVEKANTSGTSAINLASAKWCLFGRNNAGDFGVSTNGGALSPFIGKIYEFSIKDTNGDYVLNYVPAIRDSDGVYGMYDTVNAIFHTSAISTGFTGGND